MSLSPLRLGVNIDHIATIRNARGGTHPDPVDGAIAAIKAGANGITAHLREDRRHITDEDMVGLAALCEDEKIPLNMEMAATDEMLAIAKDLRPHAVCLVPERREERTTEGGLDVAALHNQITPLVGELADAGSRVSLFIEAVPHQLEMAARIGAPVVELHAGAYAHAWEAGDTQEIKRILVQLEEGARIGAELGLEVHAGHGLTHENVGPVASIAELVELNIGHFLIGEAVFLGIDAVIKEMRRLMDEARGL